MQLATDGAALGNFHHRAGSRLPVAVLHQPDRQLLPEPHMTQQVRGHPHFHFTAQWRRQANHRLPGGDKFVPLYQQGFYLAGKRGFQYAFFQ